EVVLERENDVAQLLEMAFSGLVAIRNTAGIEIRVERDHFDRETTENTRQNTGNVAVRIVDDDAKACVFERFGFERLHERARVAFQRPRRKIEQTDFVHARSPEILAEKQILDFSLRGFV